MKVLLKFVAHDDTTEDTLLIAEEAHDGAGSDGDKPVFSMDRSRMWSVAIASFATSCALRAKTFNQAVGYEGSLRHGLIAD